MDRCTYCNRPVDTDMDTDCYQPDPRHSLASHPDICVCEVCRDSADHDTPDEYNVEWRNNSWNEPEGQNDRI